MAKPNKPAPKILLQTDLTIEELYQKINPFIINYNPNSQRLLNDFEQYEYTVDIICTIFKLKKSEVERVLDMLD